MKNIPLFTIFLLLLAIKHKMKIFIIILTGFLINLVSPLSSQEHRVSQHLNRVMAKSGLNMRAEPKLDARVIAKIPYDASVVLMDNLTFGLDTITTIKTEKETHPIAAYWLKVKYLGQLGYVVSAYLREDPRKIYGYAESVQGDSLPYADKHAKGLNTDIVILLEGFDCSYFHRDKTKFNWYGIYATDSTASQMRPIDFEFVNRAHFMTPHGIIAEKNKNLLIIIGSKTKMDTQHFSAKNGKGKLPYLDSENKDLDLCHIEKEKNSGFYYQKTENYDAKQGCQAKYSVYLKSGSLEQELLPDTNSSYLGSKTVVFEGDVDGDGRNDYLIDYFQGQIFYKVLYLSSQRNSNYPIAKPVAMYGLGPCC